MTGTCEFVKVNGERCRAFPIAGSTFCINHSQDPSAKLIKAAAVKKGGKMSRRTDGIPDWSSHPIDTLNELRKALSDLFNAGMSGDITTNRLTALSSVANALSKTIEGGDLEKRLEELESKIGEARR